MATAQASYTTGTVTSADGTTIGYRKLGAGPGLLLVSGGYLAAQHYMALARPLSSTFTVYVMDRRGRGRSGPPGERYRMARECEDVAALLAGTGTRLVFGHSSGGLIALQAALESPAITKVAVYEPALSMYGAFDLSWRARFERELDRGRPAEALVTFSKGVSNNRWMTLLPRWLLVRAIDRYFRRRSKRERPDEESLVELFPLQRLDVQIFNEMASSDGFADLRADVLLLDGVRTPPPVHNAIDALHATLPRAERVTLAGVGHEAPLSTAGAPLVADELRAFFGRPS
ncbi:alpha/beta fold hydrolase [Nonomuraea jiangxiensis]|uniref:Pimeloyl-ACP methyl ester carboxylesterase n=1 Tax=Nonomuraea jiangxiensis TaxID=633440 RepID=A0A1G8JBP7_9ACTN|nr:alpha/beta fold hydrolase [Nonomuraea jiangxiensis]SDI28606.1 Pimeloyl-ACP methyl ester carboxylesterase [Nonomuraea jiangxiensis]